MGVACLLAGLVCPGWNAVQPAWGGDRPPAKASQKATGGKSPATKPAKATKSKPQKTSRAKVPQRKPAPPAGNPAIRLAEAGKWREVQKIIHAAPRDPISKVLTWMYLKSPNSGAPFSVIRAFMDEHPAWPERTTLRRRAEDAIWATGDEAAMTAWFADGAATREGALWLLDRAVRENRTEDVKKRLREVWAGTVFSPDEESAFLARYGALLTAQDHALRLDRLIWERRFAEAHRELARVSSGTRMIAEARIALASMSSGARIALSRVPAAGLADPALTFERVRWLRRQGKDGEAVALLAEAVADQPEEPKREMEIFLSEEIPAFDLPRPEPIRYIKAVPGGKREIDPIPE